MIALLIDADNLSNPEWIKEAIETLERNDGSIAIRRAYGSSENLKGLSEVLRLRAIRPIVNLFLTKNTTDISLAVDAMELACLTHCPKQIVIGSGDMDFIPLVVRLRERGIRVVCVSERSKMAQDAIPAYDQIIYVGADHAVSLEVKTPKSSTASAVSTTRTSTKKTEESTPPAKVAAPKPATTKKVAKKATSTAAKAPTTYTEILKALPKLRDGQWMHLSEAAKILRDKKQLTKNAASTKLFKHFPKHFELKPATKPNQVRFIKS
jgi:uncharacterized LabA/DUF88 family protein